MDWAFYFWMSFVMLIMVGLVIVGFIGYNRKYRKQGGNENNNNEKVE